MPRLRHTSSLPLSSSLARSHAHIHTLARSHVSKDNGSSAKIISRSDGKYRLDPPLSALRAYTTSRNYVPTCTYIHIYIHHTHAHRYARDNSQSFTRACDRDKKAARVAQCRYYLSPPNCLLPWVKTASERVGLGARSFSCGENRSYGRVRLVVWV